MAFFLAIHNHDVLLDAAILRDDGRAVPQPGCLGFFQDGDVGVGVFPESEKAPDGLRYCGSPTFRANSAKRGSERRESRKK
jgi:hypothetical protein